MSERITLMALNPGKDESSVSWQLAKVFHLGPEEASEIVQQLVEGKPWRFGKPISKSQANTAKRFLTSLGFKVKLDSDPKKAIRPIDNSTFGEGLADSGDGLEETSGTAIGFHGNGMELFKIIFVNYILTVLTLGIYYFWAKTKERSYIFGSTSFGGDRFSYHGTGKELFRGGLILFLILLVIYSISWGVTLIFGAEAGVIVQNVVFPILFVFAFPALIVGAFRYRLSRTSWRSIRFSFRGLRMDALKIFLKGYLLSLLTLGFYIPFFWVSMENFWRNHSYFGSMSFRFSGEAREIYGKCIIGILLSLLTFGIYGFWLKAFLQRYYWSKTTFGNGTFDFDATGGEMFKLNLVNLFILVFTLGLGLAWVKVRNMNFIADHLSLRGSFDVNKVIQEMKDSGALGEEALDAFDVPLDII
ncbi:MAG: YjgN family protein [Nitrospinales bacterium]